MHRSAISIQDVRCTLPQKLMLCLTEALQNIWNGARPVQLELTVSTFLPLQDAMCEISLPSQVAI